MHTTTPLIRRLRSTLALLGALALGLSAHAQVSELATVAGAENIHFTDTGRSFVTGTEGVYEFVRANGTLQPIPVAFDALSPPSLENKCYFTGITQVRHMLYTACQVDIMKDSNPRYLFAMDLNGPLQMRAIYRFPDKGVINGIAGDAQGNLIVAHWGTLQLPYQGGKLLKLTMATPTQVALKTTLRTALGRPNGVKVDGNQLYYTEDPLYFGVGTSSVRKLDLAATGLSALPKTLYTTAEYIDDFTLVAGGVLITSSRKNLLTQAITGRLSQVSEEGKLLNSLAAEGLQPSAIALVPGGAGVVWFTDLLNHRLWQVQGLPWNLQPR